MGQRPTKVAIGALLALCVGACFRNVPEEALPASYVRIAIDKSDPERLLRFYFGGYVMPEPADPFQAGLLARRGGRLYVDMDSLDIHFPGAAAALSDAGANRRIDWEELERFVDETYARARSIPPTLDAFERQISFDAFAPDWMLVEVHGVMTTALRRIHVRKSDVREALRRYPEHEQLIYPAGTAFLAEHVLDGNRVETTVMRKRADGFWDYAVYGGDRKLARATGTPPRSLKSPVQCVGCHFGNKVFEPEKSFPAPASPGPHGPRELYVGDSLRDVEVVRFFDEHRKRSDTILGLYGTLFVSRLRAEQRAGTLSKTDSALLESLPM